MSDEVLTAIASSRMRPAAYLPQLGVQVESLMDRKFLEGLSEGYEVHKHRRRLKKKKKKKERLSPSAVTTG